MTQNYLILGDWNADCDVCGFKFKASQLKKRWDGLMCCSKDYELRHPQDFLRVREEKVSPPWTRPEPEDEFISDYACTLQGTQGVAGVGIAGCMRAGFVTPY